MAVDKELQLMIKSSMLGDGEPDLGEKLMRAFPTQSLESGFHTGANHLYEFRQYRVTPSTNPRSEPAIDASRLKK